VLRLFMDTHVLLSCKLFPEGPQSAKKTAELIGLYQASALGGTHLGRVLP